VDAAAATSSLELAEEIAPGLRGLEREGAFARLEERYDDLIAALEWFVANGFAEEAIRLARALTPFWQSTRRLGEATGSSVDSRFTGATTSSGAAAMSMQASSGSCAETTIARPSSSTRRSR
jgi:hypothetical protein